MQKSTHKPTPYNDYGFFGPESVVWKVFLHPASFTTGFQRTVVTEMFEPFLLASVNDTEAVMKRPDVRYDRTLQYVSTIAFADSDTVIKSSSILYKIHAHIRGNEPISGMEYNANDPDAQLWIHLTQWHSVLLAYEIFGPGKLSEPEENQYWEECRRAAAFQTIDPESVPKNRTEMRGYYQRMCPRMAATINTQAIVKHILDASASQLVNLPPLLKLFGPVIQKTMRQATVATLPMWMRELGGIKQSPREDALAIPAMRAILKAVDTLQPRQQLKFIAVLSPATAKVMEPILLNTAPACQNTPTPEECWERNELESPRVQYLKLQKKNKPTKQEKAPKDKGAANLLEFA